jgi:hypothetical protein
MKCRASVSSVLTVSVRIANAIIDDISLPDTEIGAAFFHEWEY